MDVLVVGGGPTGLTVASELQRAGRRVTMVDASSRWGGMAASIDVGGVRCDLGSHRLHPVTSDQVENLITALLGTDLQVRPRHGRIRLGGSWVRFPLQPVDLARRLPPRFVGRALVDTIAKPFRSSAGESFADVVAAGLGPAMLDWFYGPYAHKLWGRSVDDLSGELARRRIANNSPTQIARKLLRAASGKQAVFRYPTHGYGQVVDALVERCADVDARLATRVTELAPGADGVEVTLSDAGGSHGRRFDRVFWTAPAGHLADAVASTGDGEVPTFRPTTRAMVCVYLVFDGGRVTEFDAHYLPALDVLAARISEPANYRVGPDPEGRTVLCAEVVCDRGDEVWESTPEALGARVADDLRRLDITDRTPVATHIERLPSVYPVVGIGEDDDLQRLVDWSHHLAGVTTLGRQGLVVADNLHHVLDMALDAVVLGKRDHWDDRAWQLALARYRTHVVED